ncbi:MAG: CRTAC1 family protein, partial [Acidobacteriaceae bacterium]|nr:CRTAC1 family protein [Acidobacteriaceae bacterium]
GDGDPDIAVIDKAGRLAVFSNERLGDFRKLDTPAAVLENNVALAAGDVNGDGRLDFLLLRKDGAIWRLSSTDDAGWTQGDIARSKGSFEGPLLVADLDNNGALDLIAGDEVFLNDGKSFTPLRSSLRASAQAAVDVNNDGRLDVVALSSGKLVQLTNRGSKNYHWQVIRTRAAHATGDQRINSFGIGGNMELRSDLFTQKQMITSPVLHFGLGEHTLVDFARIVWPNGSVQAEFDLKPDQSILAEQRIKGSCPMLFAWNGSRMEFLKDVGPWGSALGLNVNAQGKGVYPTREWFKISGDQLVPRDGIYDLRITAEYWETYYMDHYSLLVVDHPANKDIFADERFALPPPDNRIITTANPRPFAHAWDSKGRDVTEIVRDLDTRMLGDFSKGQYQGIACDHWVELELPPDAPTSGPLYLIGQGWIHDTDATIVKALSQNGQVAPHGLSIEVPDASGRWVTARDGLGFPKGRLKTVVLDLTGIFRPNARRKLRVRTNLELYWNKLSWAPGAPDRDLNVQHVSLAAAELRYRGFSRITEADATSPEVPHYDIIQESALKWHDQEGFCTRYGNVRELLNNIDDRYVITSPGDELRMSFRAPAPPPAGWARDFVLICDGWVKDGDYNSTFSKTVAPLPYHGMSEYTVDPGMLEAERAYRAHPSDWQTYQTRYVSPRYFERALWDDR